MEPLKLRTSAYNGHVRGIAVQHGALLVDYRCFEKFQEPRMWAPDRLHMPTAGYKYMAKKVLEVFGAQHTLRSPVFSLIRPRTRIEVTLDDAAWLRRDVAPWISRRFRGSPPVGMGSVPATAQGVQQ